MTDQEWIASCRKLIEEKFQLPANGSWKERDFQYLSDLLFEKTSTRLSISTLKRIWKGPGDRNPQLYTLNALATLLGHESWNDFKNKVSPDRIVREQPVKTKPSKKTLYWSAIAVLFIIALLLVFYFRSNRTSYDPSTITFKSRKNLSSGVPNTVVFEYDISKANFDSAFIQHTWDRRMRARITKENNTQTFIYYYPGYHTARLTLDTTVVKRERVNISTEGWQAIVDNNTPGRVPQYISPKDMITDKGLYVRKELVEKNEESPGEKEFFVNFFNVGNFKALDGNNFTLETRIKNSLDDGAFTCQYTQLTLICENNLISIPFSNPGCVSNIHIHVVEILKEGKKNDLSAFGIDLSGWKDIRIQAIDKNLTVYVDKKPVYTLRYTGDPGKVTGMHYKFYGCGAVAHLNLHTAGGELVYSENF